MYCSKAWTTQLPRSNQKNDEQTYVMIESFATSSQGWKMLDKVLHNSKSKNLHLQHIEIKEYSEDFYTELEILTHSESREFHLVILLHKSLLPHKNNTSSDKEFIELSTTCCTASQISSWTFGSAKQKASKGTQSRLSKAFRDTFFRGKIAD